MPTTKQQHKKLNTIQENYQQMHKLNKMKLKPGLCRDVMDSESVSESDGIRHFFRNPKSDVYVKSDRI